MGAVLVGVTVLSAGSCQRYVRLTIDRWIDGWTGGAFCKAFA